MFKNKCMTHLLTKQQGTHYSNHYLFLLDYVLNYQEAMKGKMQILFASKPIQAMNNKVGPLIYVNKA